jgi:hypothetical protein
MPGSTTRSYAPAWVNLKQRTPIAMKEPAMTRCIFILHTSENSIDNLPFEDMEPDPHPPKLDWAYRYLSGQYCHIPTIWWVSDCQVHQGEPSQVVPQVGWYVDVPIEPAECTNWGIDVRVVRVKLCRDYCLNKPAPISHVEIVCRVVYEEG